ncbi:hypothetical protein SPIRO4BDMA_50478 [uncultured spirochete]|uniref:Uncharacterized protein n=1 Tax=uncultured spirochete TaxID=156406 RepID=A0A3P3XST3_9SPIR|nr:hypothetical protein SPIRO4BDMA_50478 [uncultured spirochete]
MEEDSQGWETNVYTWQRGDTGRKKSSSKSLAGTGFAYTGRGRLGTDLVN